MFTIQLIVPPNTELSASGRKHAKYKRSLHDILALIIDACRALYDFETITFQINGFGLSPWPLDTFYDLSVFCGQLDGLVQWLRRASLEPFELDMYSQGIERALSFRLMDDVVKIHCESRTDWVPDPSVEEINRIALIDMISEFTETFIALVSRVTPDIYGHPWFQDWQAEIKAA